MLESRAMTGHARPHTPEELAALTAALKAAEAEKNNITHPLPSITCRGYGCGHPRSCDRFTGEPAPHVGPGALHIATCANGVAYPLWLRRPVDLSERPSA
jgi:hypothetical protein